MESLVSCNPDAFYLYTRSNALRLRYDAWYVILVAVLLALAATVLIGLSVWCVVRQHGAFTGQFRWITRGVKVSARCVR